MSREKREARSGRTPSSCEQLSPTHAGPGGITSRFSLLASCFIIAATLLTPTPGHAQVRAVLVQDTRPGRPAPALELPQVTAAGVSAVPYVLARELGLAVVLSFCPSLGEPACSGVWQGWQDPGATFGGGVSVVGVTGNPPGEAAGLAARIGLRGRFLSDSGGREARRWGVPERAGPAVAVFVVTPEGRIAYRDLQYDPSDSGAWGRLWQAVAAVRMPSHP